MQHELERKEAIERIDHFLDDLAERDLPAGIGIVNRKKSWTENVMNISFGAKKGFLTLKISGTVTVEDKEAIIDMEIPSLVFSVIKEEELRRELTQRTQKLLSSAD